MKRFICWFLLLSSAFVVIGVAQSYSPKNITQSSRIISSQRKIYYISIARANAAQFSKRQWQQTANTLKRGGIPVFFADHQSMPSSDQIKGDWLLIRINRRLPGAAADTMMLGPFTSKQTAGNAVNKLPRLLSDEGQPLTENYPGEWSMGYYIIMGERTK